jgi:hypothetical protein
MQSEPPSNYRYRGLEAVEQAVRAIPIVNRYLLPDVDGDAS